VWIRPIKICHDRIGLPTIRFFIVLVSVYDDSDGKQVVYFFKWNGFLPHFVPYRIDGLRPAEDGCINALFIEYFLDGAHEIMDEALSLRFLFIQLFCYKLIGVWVG